MKAEGLEGHGSKQCLVLCFAEHDRGRRAPALKLEGTLFLKCEFGACPFISNLRDYRSSGGVRLLQK